MRAIPAVLLAACLVGCAEPSEPVSVADAPEGDLVYRRGTMAIRLTEQPCGFREIEKLLEEEGAPPVHAYVMVQEGRPQVRGCWVRAAYDDEVLLQDMGGGDSFIPLSWFRREPGV
jgi:hypothetical protein